MSYWISPRTTRTDKSPEERHFSIAGGGGQHEGDRGEETSMAWPFPQTRSRAVEDNQQINNQSELLRFDRTVEFGYLDDGSFYQGQYSSSNEPHGTGVLESPLGVVYEGQLSHGIPNGLGVRRFPSGAMYAGELLNGHANGYGVFMNERGDQYTGEWKASLRHGFGMLVDSDGSTRYGSFVDDELDRSTMVTWEIAKPHIHRALHEERNASIVHSQARAMQGRINLNLLSHIHGNTFNNVDELETWMTRERANMTETIERLKAETRQTEVSSTEQYLLEAQSLQRQKELRASLKDEEDLFNRRQKYYDLLWELEEDIDEAQNALQTLNEQTRLVKQRMQELRALGGLGTSPPI